MATLTANQARQKAASLKLNPNDYGIASWSNADYQTLANALNVNIGGANNINKILAYPGGSTDPVTKQILNEQQTQQAASSYNKENAIAEIKKLASDYVDTAWNSSSYTQKGMDAFKANFESKIKALFEKTKNYVNPDEFNSIFSQSANDRNTFQVNAFKENNKSSGGLLGFVEKAAPIITNIGAGVITGGLSFLEQIAANSLIQLTQGVNPSDMVKNVAATVAANSLTQGVPGVESSKEIPNILNKINTQIANLAPDAINPALKSALINAERQSVAALITGQDVAKNAVAGAAGGTIADLVGTGLSQLSPAMSKAVVQSLSRAAAEYAQYKTAGFSDAEALQKATTGYLAQQQQIENAAAKEKQQTAGLTAEQVGIAQTYGQAGGQFAGQPSQYTGVESGTKSLAPVEVTATSETAAPSDISLTSTAPPGARRTSATEARSLAPVTVYGVAETAAPEDISVASTQTPAAEEPPPEQTPEQIRQDMILTSLINKNVSTPLYSSKTKTVTQKGSPGTAALAQALRVGDIGAPIFGRDEEGRRAGWNLQSLRYMGDVGAEK